MAITVTANENGKHTFRVPVSWRVWSNVYVTADSAEEALEFAKRNLDAFPIDYDEAEYAEDSYQIDAESAEEVEEC
jgi:hypothetical protein